MARNSNVKISLLRLFLMRIKRISVKKVINALLLAKKGEIDIDCETLERHQLKGGDVMNVVLGLIASKTAHVHLSLQEAFELDLDGVNLFEKVKLMAKQK